MNHIPYIYWSVNRPTDRPTEWIRTMNDYNVYIISTRSIVCNSLNKYELKSYIIREFFGVTLTSILCANCNSKQLFDIWLTNMMVHFIDNLRFRPHLTVCVSVCKLYKCTSTSTRGKFYFNADIWVCLCVCSCGICSEHFNWNKINRFSKFIYWVLNTPKTILYWTYNSPRISFIHKHIGSRLH